MHVTVFFALPYLKKQGELMLIAGYSGLPLIFNPNRCDKFIYTPD